MTADNPTPHKQDADAPPLGSPYGPQPHGTDEAAGGADSSPLENVPSGDQAAQVKERPSNKNPNG